MKQWIIRGLGVALALLVILLLAHLVKAIS